MKRCANEAECDTTFEPNSSTHRFCTPYCQRRAEATNRCACGALKMRSSENCRTCAFTKRTGYPPAERNATIVLLWDRGYTIPAIAQALHSTPQAISSRIQVMRARGVDLPKRRTPRPRQ